MSPGDMVTEACDNTKHKTQPAQAYCLSSAKRMLKEIAAGISILERYDKNENGGNAFALAVDDKQLTGKDLEISGLQPLSLIRALR